MEKVAKIITYVTRDIERALGMNPASGGSYFIIANKTPYAETIANQFPDNVWLIDGGKSFSTYELLQHPKVQERLSKTGNNLIVFKNTEQIEALTREKNWKLLNPSSVLAEKIENKISQVDWLGELGKKYLPEHKVTTSKEIVWNKKPFILQWEHGHTGDGTLLIQSLNELEAVQAKFPERMARSTEFIRGPSFTVNVVVTTDKILMGNISYQITGAMPFTDNMFSTVGNDWGLTHSLLSDPEIVEMDTFVSGIGDKLQKEGWCGLFGVDFIYDEDRNRMFLIEINARQPASTTYESIIQQEFRKQGIVGLTMFEAHISSLLGESVAGPIIPINDGAQVIQRVTKNTKSITEDVVGALELAGYNVISYPNTELNSDLIRIQSMRGIMETNNKFNARGKEILEIL